VLRLYDTALREVRELQPRDPGQISIYVCGPTVDAVPHIGHGRFALVWDVLRRYLEWSGFDVRFITNVTDIDDKIIARANEEGRGAADVAVEYEKVWWDTMDRLGVKRPTEDPHATAYVDRMIELIEELVERGDAYQGTDGVYFATDTVPDYGLLAPGPVEDLMAGARVAVDEEHGKRAPNDFALWKSAKPGEPSWDSPWGPGRPGWHTECVVMSLDLLGEDFDLHGGGIDLAFPHHENERAQAEADGKRFARRWTHSAHLLAEDEEKMSKSLGNVVSLSDLVSRYDPRAFRLLVLQSHYRKPMTVSDATLTAGQNAIERLDAFARRFHDNVEAPDPEALAAFRDRMDDDLDTVGATAQLFELVTRANALADEGQSALAGALAAAVFEMARAVGLTLGTPSAEVDEDAAALAAERDEARKNKDYARADAIRQQLMARGWIVEDTPEGTIIRR
jgi:cysteinyl-tRNA synthetase